MQVAHTYFVAVKKSDIVVGHLPRKIFQMCSSFSSRQGNIHCVVSDERKYLKDLPQGGLKILCRAFFTGELKDIKTC